MKFEGVDDLGKKIDLGGIGFYRAYGTKRWGTLSAIDPSTNKLVWQKELPHLAGYGSGTLTTAGGLVFHGMPDGNFAAFDGKTGEELWRFQTGYGADAPAATYEVDGTQYVVIATGGNRIPNSERGDGLWAFSLDGTLGPAAAPPTPLQYNVFASAPIETTNPVIGRAIDPVLKQPAEPAEYAFGPERARVAVGSTVTWTNLGEIAHTATDQKGTFDTGELAPGASASIVMDTPGTYIYFCQPHPWMLAELVVYEP